MYGFTKQQATNHVATVPAPVGGINAYDSLAAMPETDAISMVNWFAQPYGCIVRRGCMKWATGLDGEVRTLMLWNGATGATHMFGVAGGKIYDVTTQGAVGAPIATGFTSDYFSWVDFANVAGQWLVAVNGQNNAFGYGPSGLFSLTAGDGVTLNTWKNIAPASAVCITAHQGRIWVVQKDSTFGWYLPTDQYYGVFARYDFGPFFPNGGYLDSLTTWTIDSGDGASDLLVAFSSKGDVVVYEGTDVTDPTKWTLKGVYFIGAPIPGHRCYTKVAGDLFTLTDTGVVSMSTVFLSSQVSVSSDTVYSKKIQNLLSDATASVGDLPNWQLSYFPAVNQLYINVPTVTSEGNAQIVANTITAAWSMFVGYKAACWANYLSKPFFGDSNGNVLVAWTGFKDYVELDGTAGSTIRTSIQQAYSYMKMPAVQKQVDMYRPNFLVSADIVYGSQIDYDFSTAAPTEPSGGGASSASLWDTALWDVASWYGGLHTQRDWTQAQGVGVAASLYMKTSSEADITWVSTDYTYKAGGIL